MGNISKIPNVVNVLQVVTAAMGTVVCYCKAALRRLSPRHRASSLTVGVNNVMSFVINLYVYGIP